MSGRILVRPMSGLCNRLAVVSSFAALARRADRELRVCWGGSAGWSDEDLNDLFENEFARIEERTFDALDPHALRLHGQVRVTGTGGLDEEWVYGDGPGLAGVFDPVAYPTVTYRGGRPCQALLAPEDRRRLLPRFDRDFTQELRAWRPVAPIREQVAGIVDGFGKRTVGLHIRRGDALQAPWAEQYQRSSDAAFIARMDRILRDKPGTTFFLATDSEETQRRFLQRYGDAIRVNSAKQFVPSVYGSPKDNQADAVIDLFALARTRMIIGSYYSSYSKTAAALGGVRLSVAVGDSWAQRVTRKARLGRNELVRRTRSRLTGPRHRRL